MSEPTHIELVEAAKRFLKTRGVMIIFTELVTLNRENPDVIGWNADCSVLVECKASRSDFLSDKRKPFRNGMMDGVGDFRIYFCPPGIIKPEDLPEGWMLVWFDGKKSKAIHGFKNRYKINSWKIEKPFDVDKDVEMSMMYSALRRLDIKGWLPKIYEIDSPPTDCGRKLKDYYTEILRPLRKQARSMGYALAVHGSMARDLDLVAVPWVESAADPIELVEAFVEIIDSPKLIKADPRFIKVPALNRNLYHLMTPHYKNANKQIKGSKPSGYVELSITGRKKDV